MTLPTRVSWTGAQNTGTASGTFDVSAVANGSYILLAVEIDTAANTATVTSGGGTAWSTLAGKVTMGSRGAYVFAKLKESADTTVTIAKSASMNMSWAYHIGTGSAAVAQWLVGTGKLRATAPAETTTTTGLSITTPANDYLAIGVSFEATSAAEGSSPTTSGTGWTNAVYVAQAGTNIEQIRMSYRDMSTAGATGAVTDTYANSQASNGYGIQVGVKPAATATIYDLSGTVVLTSTASGTVTKLAALSGTVPAVSTASGAPSSLRAFTGTVPAVSTAAGTITSLGSLAGTVPVVSGASGTMTARVGLAGTVNALSGMTGSVALLGSLSGTVATLTDAAGEFTLLAALAGQVDAVSGASGDMTIAVPLPQLPDVLTLESITPELTLTADGPGLELTAVHTPLDMEGSA